MIILIGPSASGKTAVGRKLEEKYNIKKVVTYTTRNIREKEIDGIDYHFISKEEFIEKKNNGFFFETMEYAGNYYGTSFESLKDNSYMILDLTGYLKYKNSYIPIKSFFFKTDKKEREKRMIKRGDKISDVNERLTLDDIAFDISKIDFDGYIIDSTNLSIEEVSEEVYSLYNKKC